MRCCGYTVRLARRSRTQESRSCHVHGTVAIRGRGGARVRGAGTPNTLGVREAAGIRLAVALEDVSVYDWHGHHVDRSWPEDGAVECLFALEIVCEAGDFHRRVLGRRALVDAEDVDPLSFPVDLRVRERHELPPVVSVMDALHQHPLLVQRESQRPGMLYTDGLTSDVRETFGEAAQMESNFPQLGIETSISSSHGLID
mmetsp:Transcript_35703/g.81102  ORF Transcript_35703/g.81102 Transcript_35703/m.81102 type:complete len:200 (+) Transcript_35703:1532-2131(+)